MRNETTVNEMVLLTYTHPTGLVDTFEITDETFTEVMACLDQFDNCSARLSTVARLVAVALNTK